MRIYTIICMHEAVTISYVSRILPSPEASTTTSQLKFVFCIFPTFTFWAYLFRAHLGYGYTSRARAVTYYGGEPRQRKVSKENQKHIENIPITYHGDATHTKRVSKEYPQHIANISILWHRFAGPLRENIQLIRTRLRSQHILPVLTG